MALDAGTRVGPYEVTAQIGMGGMGEVYRATDTNLKRQVAIKVLPESVAGDPERLARFQREAEVLAALNHPNIAAIYGLERAGGHLALVMELVEGPTLADRIAQGALPVDEALPVAAQIADALRTAHAQGIVHRDLKPANIKVRPDGTVKVLDFGLAKALDPATGASPAVSQSPTITTPAMTQAGMILGTAAYMSPEQARGRTVDTRTDIWAFGCVLYEMLTGRMAFGGTDVQDVLASVLAREPDWSAIPGDVPAHIRMLVRRCLVKDGQRRIADMSIVQFLMTDAVSAALEDGSPARMPVRTVRGSAGRQALALAGALGLGALAAGAAVWFATRPDAPAVNRWLLAPGGAAAPVRVGIVEDTVAVSPDGRRLFYVGGGSQLFRRALDELEPVAVATSQASILGSPFVSPDDEWIGFGDSAELKKATVAGGAAVSIAKTDGILRGATWNEDRTIVFATNNPDTGLQRVSEDGGEQAVLTRPNREAGESDHVFPQALPGGQAVLFTILPLEGGVENAQVAVYDLRAGTHKVVLRGGGRARYAPSGHLVYAVAGTLWAVAFDLEALETVGTPVAVETGVEGPSTIAAEFDIAADGALVYLTGGASAPDQRSLVWVDRQGREEALGTPLRAYISPRISPDGRRVAVDTRDEENDIWIWDFAGATLRRLTFHPGVDAQPEWTPDGRRVLFNSQMGAGTRELFWQAADGSGTPDRLVPSTFTIIPTAVTRDGRQVVISETGASRDIKLLSLDDRGQLRSLIATPTDERNGELSPDNRWLAYDSNESGQFEIYVRPFPDVGGGRWQVSQGGGSRPLWSRDGRELFYLNPNGSVMRVPVTGGTTWSAGTAAMLLEGPYFAGTVDRTTRTYDVAPDGKRFLMLKDVGAAGAGAQKGLVVVEHWLTELERRVPAR